jgi:deoxyribodipyrimidine photo-lyase
MNKTSIVWFNKDLRLKDNPALWTAIQSSQQIIPLFILDDSLKEMGGAQKWWLHHSLQALDQELQKRGSRLILRKGPAEDVIKSLGQVTPIHQIHWNRSYTADEIAQTERVENFCQVHGIQGLSHKGNLLFEPDTIKTLKGGSFSVYTPFWNTVQKLSVNKLHPTPEALPPMPPLNSEDLMSWELTSGSWSQKFQGVWAVGEVAAQDKLRVFLEESVEQYHVGRNVPGRFGTSRLSPHLHFGEISARDVWDQTMMASQMSPSGLSEGYVTYLKEIVWREFCAHLLFHNPRIAEQNFRVDFDGFPWGHDAAHLAAWQKGTTGYPLVDAGMRELWATGWMHNRVRMIVASFLTKNLFIHWRDGEKWFWDTLLDADQASNAANWQWVAGCGADAAPYFRIFNPILQSEKFDAKGDYIRQWIPELSKLSDKQIHAPYLLNSTDLPRAGVVLGKTYPFPIVDLKKSRDRALAQFKEWRHKP